VRRTVRWTVGLASGTLASVAETEALTDNSAPAQIFVCSSPEDVAVAREIRQILDSHRYSTWMAPDSIRDSSPRGDQILAALAGCEVMVVLLSEHTNDSEHVAHEVGIALDAGKAVIPVRVAPVALSGSLEYLLHLVQWVDAFPPPVHQHAEPLLDRLRGAEVLPAGPSLPPR
jgi:hypothetical protein